MLVAPTSAAKAVRLDLRIAFYPSERQPGRSSCGMLRVLRVGELDKCSARTYHV